MGESMARPVERRKPCRMVRGDCIMRDANGGCKALEDTYFFDKRTFKPKPCPFYLTVDMAYDKYEDEFILKEIDEYAKHNK